MPCLVAILAATPDLDRQRLTPREARAGAGCAKPRCLRSPAGRTRRACRAPCGADREEPADWIGPAQDYPPTFGNKPRGRQHNVSFVLRPKCATCKSLLRASRLGTT